MVLLFCLHKFPAQGTVSVPFLNPPPQNSETLFSNLFGYQHNKKINKKKKSSTFLRTTLLPVATFLSLSVYPLPFADTLSSGDNNDT